MVVLLGELVDEVFGGYLFFYDLSVFVYDGFFWLVGKSGFW